MRMCTFSTPTSWCLNSSGQASLTACRCIPTSDTASDVRSLESITRSRCCTSSSRTSDKPFYTLTFPFSLPNLLFLSLLLPFLHLFKPTPPPTRFYDALNASYAKPHHTSRVVSSVLKVLKHFSINLRLQYWYSDFSGVTLNETITERKKSSHCIWQWSGIC